MSNLRYKPFGEIRYGSSGLPTDRRFTGYAREKSSYVGSLDFANARYYSPYLGRFISADTIVSGAANPQAFNRYAFVLNNPLRYVDPNGHQSIPFPTTPLFDDLVQFAQQASQSLGPYAAPAIAAVGAVALTVGIAAAYENASWDEPRYTSTSFPLSAESGHEIMTTPLAGGQTVTMLGTPLDTGVNQPLVLTSPIGAVRQEWPVRCLPSGLRIDQAAIERKTRRTLCSRRHLSTPKAILFAPAVGKH